MWWLLLILFAPTLAAAGTLTDLRQPVNVVPEPIPGRGCPVPPIPDGAKYVEGEGYSIDRLLAWRNFDLNGMRYYIEYQVLKRREDGGVVTRPFPSLYMVDLNRNGQFDIPGEVWLDAKGDGRCADLTPYQHDQDTTEPSKPRA